MTFRRLATTCKSGKTCPGIWADDDNPDEAIVVGKVVSPAQVSVGLDEIAVRIPRQLLRDVVSEV